MRNGPDPAIPFAFVSDLAAPELPPEEQHHLERVRRLRVGAPLTVGDGAGRFRAVAFGPTLEVVGEIVEVPAPATLLTVGFALTKGDKPELVVQKLTEIGVDVIAPFVAARSVIRWDEAKAERNVRRWRAIAREAAAQAHRPHLPVVHDVRSFADVSDGARITHLDGEPLGPACTTVLIGPEGGWSPEEVAAVSRHVNLGPFVLRAETAAIVAGALLVAIREV